MHSDALGCILVRWDAFGHFRKFSEFGSFFGRFSQNLNVLLTWGANYYAEIRIQGLTISGANYSEAALTVSPILRSDLLRF